MRKFYMFALFLVTVFSSTAQVIVNPARNINTLSTNDRFQYLDPYDIRTVSLVGERYFFDTLYHPGEMKTIHAFYTTELRYRFDQIEGTIQVELGNGKQMLVPESDLLYCKLFIEKDTLLFKPASVPNGKKRSVVQVIYDSPRMQLYRDARKYIYRVKSSSVDGYGSDQTYDEIRKRYTYFFRKNQKGPFQLVKVDTKSFISVMPEKKSQITRLFKVNKAKGGLNISKLTQIMAELDKPVN